jgi:restriction system protein
MADINFRDYRTYLVALLRTLHGRGAVAPAAIYDEVADKVGVTHEQRQMTGLRERDNNVYQNRIQFARQGLIDGGFVIGSWEAGWQRGRWELSEAGTQLAETMTDDLELDQTLRERAAIGSKQRAEARRRSRELAGLEGPESSGADDEEPINKDVDEVSSDYLKQLADCLNERAFSTMLDHIRTMDETKFEHLVGDVLKAALGAESVTVTRKSRDGGVDGVLKLDSLGMRKAVFEAKRYAEGNTVGRPTIDAFATAARRQRADHKLFVTSSSFSKEAQSSAADEHIRLIDGTALVELMALHHIGLKPSGTFVLYEVDPAWSVDPDREC